MVLVPVFLGTSTALALVNGWLIARTAKASVGRSASALAMAGSEAAAAADAGSGESSSKPLHFFCS